MAKKTETLATADNVANLIVETAKHEAGGEKLGAQLSNMLTALYVGANGSDADFAGLFGNGKAPKDSAYVAGSIADAVRAKLVRIKDEAVKKGALGTLKTRLSEARALRKLQGIPKEAESIRAALKRYKEAKAKAEADKKAAPETKAAPVVIADNASMNDIAEAVSQWVARHGNTGAAGLAKALQDCLPVTITRRKTA